MNTDSLHVLAVSASLHQTSVTAVAVNEMKRLLEGLSCAVDVLDFRTDTLPLFDPDKAYSADYYPALKQRVERADVFLLGTPDYHGGMSSALKNFLDHFWREFSGKLFASLVASHEKGLTVTDQIRTVARQCYAWSLPYGVAFVDKEDILNGEIQSVSLQTRMTMMAHDIAVYGRLLSEQRRRDLDGSDPGFLARLRR